MFGGFGSIPHKPSKPIPPPVQAAIGPNHGLPNIHNPTPATLGVGPAQGPSQHNPTPSTLGAVPQNGVGAPRGNPPPSTLGAVNSHSVPYPSHSSSPPLLGPVAASNRPHTPGQYARHIGQFPAPELKRNRPPLVNYAPGTLKLSI